MNKQYKSLLLLAIFSSTNLLQAVPPRESDSLKQVREIMDYANKIINEGKTASPAKLESAKKLAQESLAFLTLHEKKNLCSSSSSSSSSSESTNCCKTLKCQINKLEELLSKNNMCDSGKAIAQCDLPLTINEPGKYCVTEDLIFCGREGAAITVTSDDVSINFHNHSLTLNNPGVQGIVVKPNDSSTSIKEFTLENDIIRGISPFPQSAAVAISLESVDKATLSNVYTFNTLYGIEVTGCNDIFVQNCFINNHPQAGIFIDGSQNITIDGSTFEGFSFTEFPANQSPHALFVQNTSQNITITNSSFRNWLNTFTVNQVTGMLIQDCQAIASSVSKTYLLQLGSESSAAHDVIVRNTTFVKDNANGPFDALFLLNGSGCLLENLVVDADTSLEFFNLYAGIHIGSANESFSHVLAKNLVVRSSLIGLLVDNGSDVVVSSSEFSNAALANVMFGSTMQEGNATACVIKDSILAGATSDLGSGYGIIVNSPNNAVIDCEISDNAGFGINVTGGSTGCVVRGNNASNNTLGGIYNGGANSLIYFNTACNNASSDCQYVDSSVVQLPTDTPIVAGSNVCCTSQE